MYKTVTLLFPGQGSQYVGMGKDFTDISLFSKADEILGFSLSEIIFNGPEAQLELTCNTQPAILLHSIAMLKHLNLFLADRGIEIERVLGHSVGEYAALVAAQAISFADALKIVNLRGKYMQQAVPVGTGKMVALVRVPQEIIMAAVEEATQAGEGSVMPANFNSPDQTVISGSVSAVDLAVKYITGNCSTRFRAIPLSVSAPFHCSLMQGAADKLSVDLNKITFSKLKIPYLANIDAVEYGPATSSEKIRQNLIDQICGSVLWKQSCNKLNSDSLFIEVGPGGVLRGLLKKINKDLMVISLDNKDAFLELERVLK